MRSIRNYTNFLKQGRRTSNFIQYVNQWSSISVKIVRIYRPDLLDQTCTAAS